VPIIEIDTPFSRVRTPFLFVRLRHKGYRADHSALFIKPAGVVPLTFGNQCLVLTALLDEHTHQTRRNPVRG
jgi:hypothetical protein